MIDDEIAQELAMEAVLRGTATDDQLAMLGLTREDADAERRAWLRENATS
jgi:hypothetical protein